MEATILTEVFLPLALAAIMFGMGLTLTTSDFARLWKKPKSIFIGLFGQLVILPCLAFILIKLFHLPDTAALGLMIVAACPGGTTSNIISHIAKANIALSVSLTACSTILCIVTTPLIIGFAIQLFDPTLMSEFSIIETTIGLLVITLIPVSLGMLLRAKKESLAVKSESFFRKFSTLFLVFMVALIVVQEWDTIMSTFVSLMPSALMLTTTASFIGFMLGWAFKENLANSLTLGIEIGIQNATLAILIAISFLGRPDLATAAGMYGLVMFAGAFFIIFFSRWFSGKVGTTVV